MEMWLHCKAAVNLGARKIQSSRTISTHRSSKANLLEAH
jgi:hypothetical protein